MLRMVTLCGGAVECDKLELWISPKERARAQQRLGLTNCDKTAIVVAFGIGAAAPARRWASDGFAELAVRLDRYVRINVVLFGAGEEDKMFAARVVAAVDGIDVVDTVDELNVRESAALLELCDLYVGNDSGPLHMAAAVGTPVVEISGLPEGEDPESDFSPDRFGPWGVPNRVVRPGHTGRTAYSARDDVRALRIEEVSVEQVYDATVDLINSLGIMDQMAVLRER
jgi:ADP-heptose:LPS heptosyltransferase